MPKYLTIFFLFLLILPIVLPIVSASSFTGTFNDYGKDSGSDGKFDYLTIEAQVNINDAGKDYVIYGILEDSQGNTLPYDECRSVSSTGIQNFILDFNGLKLYKNKVNGPYTLKYIELSRVGSCGGLMPPESEQSLINTHTTQAYQYTQFQRGEPAISCTSSPCTAPSTLIKSRDNLNTPEPNAPNTIDGCEDGSAGSYLNDESIESITVTSLNNSFFEIGDTVRVDINVYCSNLYHQYDKLNFVYSNDIDDIQWQIKDKKQCSSTGIKTLSTTFKLDNNVGNHSIRGVFIQSSYSFDFPDTICGEDDSRSNWADTDDIIIYVKEQVPEPEPQGPKINLTQGWNLISLPKITNNDITAIANIFNNNFEKIITLKNNKWYLYDKSINSNLDQLSEADGFWIKVNNDLSISIENESAQYTTLNLTPGWNLIGYPSLEEKGVNELFKNVINDIGLIYIYNNKFFSFNPQNPYNLIIKPGTGIFVKAKNNANWRFNGTYNKEETQGEPPETFNLDLFNGWNLISIPLTSDQTINDIFGSTNLYYLENNIWKQLQNNDKINYPYGYWIKTVESSLIIGGAEINSLDFNINQGWNIINYPLKENKNTNTFFNNVMGNIESIATYENGEWKTYVSSKQSNSLTILEPGKGIFIKAKTNANWNFNGNELVAT